jgi:hypothetical protein
MTAQNDLGNSPLSIDPPAGTPSFCVISEHYFDTRSAGDRWLDLKDCGVMLLNYRCCQIR